MKVVHWLARYKGSRPGAREMHAAIVSGETGVWNESFGKASLQGQPTLSNGRKIFTDLHFLGNCIFFYLGGAGNIKIIRYEYEE